MLYHLTLRSPHHFEKQSDEKSPRKPRFLASLETLALPVRVSVTVRNVSYHIKLFPFRVKFRNTAKLTLGFDK